MSMKDVQQYDIVEATFTPKVLETLKPIALPFVGEQLRLQAAWVVTDEDGGPYVGQMVFLPEPPHQRIGWIPAEDLQDIKVLGDGHD